MSEQADSREGPEYEFDPTVFTEVDLVIDGPSQPREGPLSPELLELLRAEREKLIRYGALKPRRRDQAENPTPNGKSGDPPASASPSARSRAGGRSTTRGAERETARRMRPRGHSSTSARRISPMCRAAPDCRRRSSTSSPGRTSCCSTARCSRTTS